MQIEETSNFISDLLSINRKGNLTDIELQKLVSAELGKTRELFEMDGYNLYKEELEKNPIGCITNKILNTYNNQMKASNSKNIMVIDKRYLLREYTDMMSTEETINLLEGKYGIKVILIDSSMANIDSQIVAKLLPIYLI